MLFAISQGRLPQPATHISAQWHSFFRCSSAREPGKEGRKGPLKKCAIEESVCISRNAACNKAKKLDQYGISTVLGERMTLQLCTSYSKIFPPPKGLPARCGKDKPVTSQWCPVAQVAIRASCTCCDPCRAQARRLKSVYVTRLLSCASCAEHGRPLHANIRCSKRGSIGVLNYWKFKTLPSRKTLHWPLC